MYDFHCWADAQPDRIAVVMANSGRKFSAGALATKSKNYAQWLASQNIGPEDTVAVLLENRIEILELTLATRLVGAYIVVINTHLTASEVSYIVRDCEAKLLFFSNHTHLLAEATGITTKKYVVDEQSDGSSLVSLVNDYLKSNPAQIDFSNLPVGRDLLYSSGTTGRPKGIKKPLLPSAVRSGIADPELAFWAKQLNFNDKTIYLSPAPLYHAAPLRTCIRVLNTGGKLVIMEHFNTETALSLIQNYQVTHSQWVPTMFQRMLALPQEIRQRYDVSSQKCVVHAAAPCPIHVKQAMLDWWGDILIEYYAGSESCGTTLINSKQWRSHPGSVGQAVNCIVHITADDGTELPANTVGNIYFSGITPFSYLNDPDKTKAAFNDKGWATYGDLGYVDDEGYLYLSDRRTDLIISGGVNIYPKEIEDVLSKHPAIADLAVIGIPHPDLGEQVLAIVATKPAIQQNADLANLLVDYAANELSRLKLPRRMVFVESIPRLETGKLRRRDLKEHYKNIAQPGLEITLPAKNNT